MSGRRYWAALLASALFGFAPAPATADVVRGSSSEERVAPDENFEADCLGDSVAEDCELRAALMEGELASLLAFLEDDTDPATQALFESALDLDNPVIGDLALRYVARRAKQPEGFWETAKSFFFGSDAPLASRAATILSNAPEQPDRDLAAAFAEGRNVADYEQRDALLAATVKDARFDAVPSFAEEELFEPADRLLMYDRVIRSLPPPEPDYPVTAFVTDSSVEDVSDFFTQLFGKSLGTYAGAKASFQDYTLQLASLQGAAAKGDLDALEKLAALSSKIGPAQDMMSLGALLQLEAIHAEDDQVWLDGTVKEYFHAPVRAVTVGHDDALDKTVIRYVNAAKGTTGNVGNVGNAGASGDDDDDDDSPGAGGASEPATRSTSKSSGCGCSVPRESRSSAPLAALVLLVLGARRAGSRRRSS